MKKLLSFLAPSPIYPQGVGNVNWFGFFNAISFCIFLGTPVILFAKSLGASETTLGLLASITPLLTVLQIPAAYYIPRFGYRRFTMAGWGLRNVVIFISAVLPLLVFLNVEWRLGLLFGCFFAFNVVRGFTGGAWLPWLTEILPEPVRPRFISRDQRFIQIGCLLSFLICGLVLERNSPPWAFALVLLISALTGVAALHFLKRVPDAAAPEQFKRSGQPVPWLAILAYPPFARLLVVNVLWTFTVGGMGVFNVTFLRESARMGENQIILVMIAASLAAFCSLGFLGRMMERFGTRRTFYFSLATQVLYVLCWLTMASGLVGTGGAVGLALVVGFFALGGVSGVAFGVANTRISMDIIPEMGRSHFFALFGVVGSLAGGVSPIAWGWCLDALRGLHVSVLGAGVLGETVRGLLHFEWNRYSVYYTAMAALLLLTLFAARFLRERPASPALRIRREEKAE